MTVQRLWVSGYRSIRELNLPFGRVNVITGPNGCGKSNLYRSVYLLAAAARGELARTLAQEGGMPSVLWAGPRRQVTRKSKPVRLSLGIEFEDVCYELSCGLPKPSSSVFARDPEVKQEQVWVQSGGRKVVLLERKGPSAWMRDDEGRRVSYPLELSLSESVLSQLIDPQRYPEITRLREELRRWRFYHQFRTDPDSPLRQVRTAVHTPLLADDGRDLLAALQTIREDGDRPALEQAITSALPQVERLDLVSDDQVRLTLELYVSGMRRPIELPELSDGTLRYLCLVAVLLSTRPPTLVALNEPESSLHPDLIDPLAELLAWAAQRTQLWVTTHSTRLAERAAELSGEPSLALEMDQGETLRVGVRRDGLDW